MSRDPFRRGAGDDAMPLDGSFYVIGRTVHRAPLVKKTPTGRSISLGFPVCVLSGSVGNEAAQIIADALNDAQRRAAIAKAEGGDA